MKSPHSKAKKHATAIKKSAKKVASSAKFLEKHEKEGMKSAKKY